MDLKEGIKRKRGRLLYTWKSLEDDRQQLTYENGEIPNDWRLTSTFVTIPKKSNAKTSKDLRLISLRSHALKAFLQIIHKRIYYLQNTVWFQKRFRYAIGLVLHATDVLKCTMCDT